MNDRPKERPLAAERAFLTDLARRIELVLTIDGHPGLEIDEVDLTVIKFALRFTAARL